MIGKEVLHLCYLQTMSARTVPARSCLATRLTLEPGVVRTTHSTFNLSAVGSRLNLVKSARVVGATSLTGADVIFAGEADGPISIESFYNFIHASCDSDASAPK